MICLLAISRWCVAFAVWLATWCVVGTSDVQRFRATLEIGLTAVSQQPAALLAAADWGMRCRLVDPAFGEQQRTEDSCGPAALRRLLRNRSTPTRKRLPGRPQVNADAACLADEVDGLLETQGAGCSLGDLQRAAVSLGLPAILRTVHHVDCLTAPAILHLRRGHFVVFEDWTNGRLRLFDPAHGVVLVRPPQLARQLSGAALQFTQARRRPPEGQADP